MRECNFIILSSFFCDWLLFFWLLCPVAVVECDTYRWQSGRTLHSKLFILAWRSRQTLGRPWSLLRSWLGQMHSQWEQFILLFFLFRIIFYSKRKSNVLKRETVSVSWQNIYVTFFIFAVWNMTADSLGENSDHHWPLPENLWKSEDRDVNES